MFITTRLEALKTPTLPSRFGNLYQLINDSKEN